MNTYSKLAGDTLEYTSSKGTFTLVVQSASRGTGSHKYCITISGVGTIPDTSDGQFYVSFNNSEYGAGVKIKGTREDFALIELDTIINDEEFWK